jgi:sugar phosphate permease
MGSPTTIRYRLLGLIFLLTVITYLDRLCISAAMPSIASEFGLNAEQKGWIFSAFTFAYHIPWQRLFTSANLLFICLMYIAYGYGLYFYLTWLPTYLLEARGFSRDRTILFSALPWLISAPAFWFGGWVTDKLAMNAERLRLARCGVGVTGYLCSAITLVIAANVKSDLLAGVLLAFALAFQTTTISSAWAV